MTRATRRFIAATATALILSLGGSAPSTAFAHHLLATPHYHEDERFDTAVLTAREEVGPWQVELLHAPGNPEPGDALLEVRVTEVESRTPYRNPVTATLHRVGSFNSNEIVGEPQRSEPTADLFSFELCYPKEGLYWVELMFGEGEDRATVNFSVIAGKPGKSGFWVATAFLALLTGAAVVRATLLRRRSERSAT